MLEYLQDFFENNALDEVREKLESYNIEFTNSNAKEGKFIINENGKIDIIFNSDYKDIFIPNYHNPFPLLNKHKCRYSFIYDDNDYIELKIKDIKDLYKNKCGDKICINAPYCNFHKYFIKYLMKYYNNKYKLKRWVDITRRQNPFSLTDYSFVIREYKHQLYLSKILIANKIININEVKIKFLYNQSINNIDEYRDNIILKIGK